MNVLLSIRPEYAEAIFRGTKRYEFRRTIFKNEDVTTIYLYANSSLQRIVGHFDVGQIIRTAPKELWARFNAWAGVSEDRFFQYFDGCELGYAIEVLNPYSYQPPVNPYLLFDDFKPPQSFYYFSKEQLAVMEARPNVLP